MSVPTRAWHIHRTVASELRQRVRQTRLIVIELYEQSSERRISSRKMWNKWITQGERHWNRVLCRDHQLQRLKLKTAQVFGRPSGLVKKPAQDLSGDTPIPSADETLTNPEIPAVPSGVIPSSSVPVQTSPGASSISGVKRTYSERTTLPNLPGITSGSGVNVCVVGVLCRRILRLSRRVAG